MSVTSSVFDENYDMLLRPFLKVFLILLAGFSPVATHAQVIIDNTQSEYESIHSYCKILPAGQQTYSIDEVLKNQSSLPWEEIESANPNLGFTKDYFWLSFEVINNSNTRKELLFETARPVIDSVTLYAQTSDGSINVQKSGDAIPFSERSVKHRKSLFKLTLDKGENQTYFLKIKSDGEALMLPLAIKSNDTVLAATYQEQLFYGFFYGLLSLAFIIYLFFYFALKDSTFLYYSVYVVFIGLLQFALDGFFYQYVMPESGWLYNRMVLIIALFGAFFLGKYGEVFLNIKKHQKAIHNTFKVLYAGLLVTFLALLFVPSFLEYGYPIANGLGLIVLVLIVSSVVYQLVKGIKVDLFFVAGIACLVLGFVLFIMNNFNAISNSFLAENAPKFGTGLEIIFLSTSMSNRIRLLKKENETNQQLALQREIDMNEIKSLFLSNISHELRTPLNLIMGVTSSLHHNSSDPELQQKYDLVLNSSKTLLGSIEDILNFTVIEKGNQLLKNRSFSIHEMLKHQVDLAYSKIESKDVEFFVRSNDDMPEFVIGDEDKLSQILSNLIDNAIKFTEHGKVELFVKAKTQKDGKVQIEFFIQDTGIGINEEKMKTIFESFTKKSFNDKREFGGLGLGLYIAKTYSDLMDGELIVENNLQGGVTCRLSLQLDVDSSVIQKKEEKMEITDYSLSPCKILLVEDNMMNQMVIKLLVSRWENATLEIANNGLEGVEALKNGQFDCVLMDLQMPVMDGFEAISTIRGGQAGAENTDIPIITITADITDKTKQLVHDLGVNAYMTKPLDGDELFVRIRNFLGLKVPV